MPLISQMKNLRHREVKWLAQGHTLLMMGWKNKSGWDCFAFVPQSPGEAARRKTGLEDQISAGKSSEEAGAHLWGHKEPGRQQGPGWPPSATGRKLLDGQSCPVKGPYNIWRDRRGSQGDPSMKCPLEEVEMVTEKPLSLWKWTHGDWQKMKPRDTEATETALFGDHPSPLSPHTPMTHPAWVIFNVERSQCLLCFKLSEGQE